MSLANTCVARARDRWGRGWAWLSDEQREAEVSREIVLVLREQHEDHAHEQIRRLQAVARDALASVSVGPDHD